MVTTYKELLHAVRKAEAWTEEVEILKERLTENNLSPEYRAATEAELERYTHLLQTPWGWK